MLLALMALTVFAQEDVRMPHRTAEERAMKQTEMLVRDLGITDSVTRDTLYRVHLKYARTREQVTDRKDAVECINRLLAELKQLLTPAQYERLQSLPLQQGARAPQAMRDSVLPPSKRQMP